MTNDEMTEREREIAALVREHADARFESGFSDRVAARLSRERPLSIPTALQRQFLRIVPIAAAASIALAAYNVWSARGTGATGVDAMLNLPQVTLASAYAPAALFGGAAATESP